MSDEAPELDRFLADVHFLLPNLNDTFYYASGDTEQIGVGDGPAMAALWRRFGWFALVAIAADIRKQDPLKEIAEDPRFAAALAALDEPWGDQSEEPWTIRDEVTE